MKKVYWSLMAVLVLLFSYSCKENNKNNSSSEVEASNKEVLKNWAENIIIPSYQAYQKEVLDLNNLAQNLNDNAQENELNQFKEQWEKAYKAFQRVLIFNFSAAEKNYFNEMSNTFPTNVENIQKNIQLIKEGKADKIQMNPSFLTSKQTYQGFPALDYLLFAEDNTTILAQNEEGNAVRTYILMLTKALKDNTEKVLNYWIEHQSKYINSTDNSVTGAYSGTINAFIKSYEKDIRAYKVGYAAGAINAQSGKAAPEIIEAYYKGDISKELLSIALQSSQDFFNGKHFSDDKNGASLASILKGKNKEDLVKEINQQYDVIQQQIESLQLDLKELALTDQDKMLQLYKAIQVNVANYKTKMVNALKIQIGYQDTDGD